MRNDKVGSRRRRGISIVLALTLATGVGVTGTAAASPAAPALHSVTLITGDRVIIAGDGNVATVEPTADRKPMAFSFATVAGHEYVIPLDALRLIATGRLDRQLFDVVALTRLGYDDTGRTLPLIVTRAQGAPVRYAPARTDLAAYWHQITGGSRLPTMLIGGPDRIDLDAPHSTADAPKARTGATPVHTLTLHYLDPNGNPTSQFDSFLFNAADGSETRPVPDANGTATLQLPDGDYSIGNEMMVPSPSMGLPTEFFDLPYPNLKLTADTVVDVDARLAKPIAVTPPDHPATGGVEVDYVRTVAGAPSLFGIGSFNTTDDVLLTAHLGPPLPGLIALIDTEFGPSPLDPAGADPIGYRLFWLRHNTYPTGFVRTVHLSDLARIDVNLGAASRSGTGAVLTFPNIPGVGTLGSTVPLGFVGRATLYMMPNTAWTLDVASDGIDQIAQPRQFQAGREYDERIDVPVLGPSLPRTRTPTSWIRRTGDLISSHAPLFSDAANRAGDARVTTQFSLFRNGTLIAEEVVDRSGFDATFIVSPDPAQYQVVYAADRSAFGDFTTQVNVAWTFQSAHVDGSGNLPVSVVRFTPALDANGAAPAGRVFHVPFSIQTQQGVTQGGVQRLEVDASYDDGQTWTAVPVVGHTALLHHPATGNFVLLRAKLTFGDGSALDQTIIHAYRLRT
jgi:hypothetical protein